MGRMKNASLLSCHVCKQPLPKDRYRKYPTTTNTCSRACRTEVIKQRFAQRISREAKRVCQTCGILYGRKKKKNHPGYEGKKQFALSRFCSRVCARQVFRKDAKELSTNGLAWRAAKAVRGFKMQMVCERCGKKKEDGVIIDIHHKDQDRTNNSRSNLEILCKTCHIKHHQGSRKRRLNKSLNCVARGCESKRYFNCIFCKIHTHRYRTYGSPYTVYASGVTYYGRERRLKSGPVPEKDYCLASGFTFHSENAHRWNEMKWGRYYVMTREEKVVTDRPVSEMAAVRQDENHSLMAQ